MGNFFSDIASGFKGIFGLNKRGSGGTSDAFQQFEQYVESVTPGIQARLDEIGREGVNPLVAFGQLSRPLLDRQSGLDSAINDVRNLKGQADRFPSLLRNAALASTGGARSNAVRAARLAGAGRGGLAFGGGAGALAARAATDATIGTNAALANALVGGEQFRLGYDRDVAALGLGAQAQNVALGKAISDALSREASFVEAFRQRQDDFRRADVQNLSNLAVASLGGGLAGNQATAARRTSFGTNLVNNIFNAAPPFGGGGGSS